MNQNVSKFENWINRGSFTSSIKIFLNSEIFLVLVSIIVLMSSSLAMEIPCFTLLAGLAIASLIFSKDTKPLLIIILTFQMGMSYINGQSYNPNPELPTIYDDKRIMGYFIVLGVLVVLALIFNFFAYKQYKNKARQILCLLPGLIALSVGYLLSGSIGFFSRNNLLYSLSKVAIISMMYLYFSWTAFTRNDMKPIKYISLIMFYVSILICLEVAHIYLTNDVISGMKIEKNNIKNGWGIHNNFAGYLNICFPFIIYLIITEKHAIRYYLTSLLMIFATIMTVSRNGYVILGAEIIAGFVFIMIYKKSHRKILSISLLSLIIASIAIVCVYSEEFKKLFTYIFQRGIGLSGREELYQIAWESFLKNPIFGKGWFLYDMGDQYIPPNSFAPNFKTHDIFLQLLGSTGIVGFIGFLTLITLIFYHTIKNKSIDKITLLMGVLSLIAASILDNFFFDYGFERFFAVFLIGITICKKQEVERLGECHE